MNKSPHFSQDKEFCCPCFYIRIMLLFPHNFYCFFFTGKGWRGLQRCIFAAVALRRVFCSSDRGSAGGECTCFQICCWSFFCLNCLLLECLAATKNDMLYLQIIFNYQHFQPLLYFTVVYRLFRFFIR